LAHNQIFLEVEKDCCDFVFSALVEKFLGRLLLRPKAQELLLYGIDDVIIIARLVTEALKSNSEPYQVPLEKLIIDLFANKSLMLSKGDYATAIETMFTKYRLDQVSMLRYARRRNKVKDVFEFLRDQTSIELMVHRWDMVKSVCLTLEHIEKIRNGFSGANIGNSKYAKLSSLRKFDTETFAYAVQAIELLER
jgi:hypothetical protein